MPLEQIAEIVRNWPTPKGYNGAIAKQFGVSRRTAERWVYLARKQGLLPVGSAPISCPRCGGSGEIRRMTGSKSEGRLSAPPTSHTLDK